MQRARDQWSTDEDRLPAPDQRSDQWSDQRPAHDQRPPRTWLAVIHQFLGLLIGTISFPLVLAGVTVGAVLAPIGGSGLPILGLTLRYTDGLAAIERSRFAGMAGRVVPPWPVDPRRRYRWAVIPSLAAFTGRATWGKICYPLPRLLASVLLFPIVVAFWAVGLATLPLTLPLYLWTNPLPALAPGATRASRRGSRRAARRSRAAQRGPVGRAMAATGRGLLFASAPRVSRRLAGADAALTRWLLSPPADLAARVTELEISRERVVDAAEAERRRIERDLHDGAQQRLVALAMELGRAKAKFGDDPDGAKDLLDRAHIEAKAALTELRNLVRGVHPPILTERGLDPALSGLAALCPIPVDVHVEVPVRPKPAVEAVAYFMVAEALTNVAKHSRASHVNVVVEGHGFPGTLSVLVSDDGIGGADPHGAGLSGLADRVSGVDGELSVESPSGGPTMISAVLPCG
jgi:signal transduction histidine kinase